MKSFVKVEVDTTVNPNVKEILFLTSLFPIKWSSFISSAKCFESEKDAIDQLNSRYSQLSESLNHSMDLVKAIRIETYNEGSLIKSIPYLKGDD